MMTRGMFFKVLAAVGMGQQAQHFPMCKDAKIGEVCLTDESCKEGEERCPLGHCQKPRHLSIVDEGEHCLAREFDQEATNKESQTERDAGVVTMKPCKETADTFMSACSTCGIVYVTKV
jgi:hypothetical protein